MAALTSSSSPVRARTNPPAQLSVVLGALALVSVPAAVAASRYVPGVRLLDAVLGAVPAAILLALAAIGAARRARRTLALTLGRAGGERAARTGRLLAVLALYLGCSGVLALVFYGILRFYS